VLVLFALSACATSVARPTATTSATASTATTVNGDEVPDPLAASARPPAVPATLGATSNKACRSGNPLANVYHPARLTLVRVCITVTGTVAAVRAESDGDIHVNVGLDAAFAALINDHNTSGEQGALVVEIVPVDRPGCIPGQAPRPASGTYDFGLCTGANELAPTVGQRVSVTGPYVLDTFHGWMEIHPVWAIVPVGSVPPAAPPSSAPPVPAPTESLPPPTPVRLPPPPLSSPAPSSPPTPAGACTATVGNATPGDGGTNTVSVASGVPNTEGTVLIHYKTTTHPLAITTDASGHGLLSFSMGHPTIGYTVLVTVDLAGLASCSTSFTPQ
jgi:hypothetical protein